MSSTLSSAESARIDLWTARDAQLRDPAMLGEFARILSPEERNRVARMRLPEGRHQQLVTRAMVRIVLSRYAPDVAPADWRFARGEHGRPSIARDMPAGARLHFNLAHTEGLVVLAVGPMSQLGVDVERVDRQVNPALARRYFSQAEVASLEALPPERRARRFQRLWTLKEAYLKALGTGVVGGLGSMTFHVDASGIRFEHEGGADASPWSFRELDLGTHLVAVAACCQAPVITQYEFPVLP